MTLSKAQFRENSLHKIKKLSQHNSLYRNRVLEKKLLQALYVQLREKRGKILFYYPLHFEANILKVMKKLHSKHEIYIPFMEGESFKMVPFRLPLKKKKFGILEAGNTHKKINKIDIAIVPAVGVDGNLQRVGFGKGMYDRFFHKLKKRPYTIFIQPELCYTKELICDSHDIYCDILISPTKVLIKRARIKKIGN
jgi:5-formyltetrahydrofolate cyclo-ligase